MPAVFCSMPGSGFSSVLDCELCDATAFGMANRIARIRTTNNFIPSLHWMYWRARSVIEAARRIHQSARLRTLDAELFPAVRFQRRRVEGAFALRAASGRIGSAHSRGRRRAIL